MIFTFASHSLLALVRNISYYFDNPALLVLAFTAGRYFNPTIN
jgi:hypothetical protein